MQMNTLKTVCGYLRTLLGRYLPIPSGAAIADVFNYVRIADALSTSGQPTATQFQSIRDAGFTTVINLAPHHAENALPDEASLLNSLGLRYVHIPVDFKKPTADDFHRFVDAMQIATHEKVWVHCAANMRVSAFVYKYRREVLHEDMSIAQTDLHKIWEPAGVWKEFLATPSTSMQMH